MDWLKDFIFLLFFFVPSYGDWIDPHEMVLEPIPEIRSGKIYNNNNNNNDLYKSGEFDESFSKSFMHLKRIVSLVLHNSHFDETSEGFFEGVLKLNMKKSDMEFLNKFAKSSIANVELLRELDSVMSDSVKKTFKEHLNETVLSIFERLEIIILEENTQILAFILLLLVVIYNLQKRRYSLRYTLGYLAVVLMLIDYAYVWKKLSDEAALHNINITAKKCDLSWSELLFGSRRDCGKKIVTPLVVFLEQLKMMTVVFKYLGAGLGQFGGEMFNELPMFWKIFLFPIMLIFVLLLFMCLSGTKISLGMPFCSINFNQEEPKRYLDRPKIQEVDFKKKIRYKPKKLKAKPEVDKKPEAEKDLKEPTTQK